MRFLAQFISWIFHPAFVPTFGVAILMYMDNYWAFVLPSDGKWRLLLMVWILTFFFPLIFTLFLRSRGVVDSFMLTKRHERSIPYVLAAMCTIYLIVLMTRLGVPKIFMYLFYSVLASQFVVFFLNVKWKVSAHATAIGGITSFFIFSGYYFSFPMYPVVGWLLLCCGVVGTSRLLLKAHTPGEVYLGYLTGFMVLSIVPSMLHFLGI